MTSVRHQFGRKKLRYLAAGALNTAFGSLMMIYIYTTLGGVLHIFIIGIIVNIINISFSYLTNKIFVFRTKGNWLAEWRRSFAVYGSSAIVTIFLNWIFVDIVGVNIYLTQVIVVIIAILISYIGNTFYTFNSAANDVK